LTTLSSEDAYVMDVHLSLSLYLDLTARDSYQKTMRVAFSNKSLAV
jgi:hypothetical protein